MPFTPDDDSAAVERVLASDTAAFSRIVERWQAPLVNLAFRFCRHEGRAEEWAQEAFVRAFRSLHQWRRESAFSTWLFAIALNVFRSERRVPNLETPVDDLRGVAYGPTPEALAIAGQNADLVRRLVDALPPKYREALVLFYFLDRDVTETAARLGVPAGTVKARLHRGRQLLKDRLTHALRRHPGSAP